MRPKQGCSRTGRRHRWHRLLPLGAVAVFILLPAPGQTAAFAVDKSANPPARLRAISLTVLEDKIRGGWAGQMIGVAYGTADEFHYQHKINEGSLPWVPGMVSVALEQDDLYVEMSFAEVLDRQGLNATTRQLGEAFRQTRFGVCHGNAGARRLLDSGYAAPLSGDPRLNIHVNDIDFQIEADFIGLMSPGLPLQALDYATRTGRVMAHGDGLYGGIFVSAMYAAAFFESDPRTVIEQALASIPSGSNHARAIRDVLQWSREFPDDWRHTWRLLEDKWDFAGSCPDEAGSPFNIQASLNAAYVVMGLLYGRGDFARTLEITTRSGQDSDSNPSIAGGVIGTVLGYSALPDTWKSGIPPIADKPFNYTNYSYNDIVESTIRRAILAIRFGGGRLSADTAYVPEQQAVAAPLENWTMGRPVTIIPTDGHEWRLQGNWQTTIADPARFCGPLFNYQLTSAGNATASLDFNGNSVALVGVRSPKGGKADLYVDGNFAAQIDFYVRKDTTDTDLWHSNALRPGMHHLELRARNDRNPDSMGNELALGRAILYDGAITD